MSSLENPNLLTLEWDLSCDVSKARDILAAALDTSLRPLIFGGGNIKGSITEDTIYIWEAFPGMRGIPIANGIVKIYPSGGCSHLSAKLEIPLLYRLIKPSTPKVVIVVSIALISWILSLTGALFETYQRLQQIFFPIGVAAIVTILLLFSYTFGDEQLTDLRNFLEGSLGTYRQAPANPYKAPVCQGQK
jgi:hypothetical protein